MKSISYPFILSKIEIIVNEYILLITAYRTGGVAGRASRIKIVKYHHVFLLHIFGVSAISCVEFLRAFVSDELCFCGGTVKR